MLLVVGKSPNLTLPVFFVGCMLCALSTTQHMPSSEAGRLAVTSLIFTAYASFIVMGAQISIAGIALPYVAYVGLLTLEYTLNDVSSRRSMRQV